MVMNIGWKDLPKSVETNIDIYTGFYESGDHTRRHTRRLWLDKVNECAAQFNASYDDDLICFIFDSEVDYTMFILRWA